MARFLKKFDSNRGLAPGELIFIGDQKVEKIRVRVIDYDAKELREVDISDMKLDAAGYKQTDTVTWINIDGLHDLTAIKDLGDVFGLHPLLLEDVLNTGQRPKLGEFDNCLLMVLKMLQYDDDTGKVRAEQLSMVLGENYLITFQEQPGDVFEPVRERIRKQKGRIRMAGIDYLAYTLLDTVVDNYIYIIESMGEKIEDLDHDVLNARDDTILEKINTLKQEMNFLRKSVRPVKEAVLHLIKLESDLIQKLTIPFLKDLQDLIDHASEAIDTYRDLLSDHFNTYNTTISNRMNEVMKVLTIIATIFIPLTFVAGIYGMNFEFMPELKWKFAYFAVWIVFMGITLGMIVYFRKKKWI
jgi:magnesium transporter